MTCATFSGSARSASVWAPETRLGTWALSLAGLALGGTVAIAVAFSAGLEPAESFSDNWLLTAAGFVILASAAASAVNPD